MSGKFSRQTGKWTGMISGGRALRARKRNGGTQQKDSSGQETNEIGGTQHTT